MVKYCSFPRALSAQSAGQHTVQAPQSPDIPCPDSIVTKAQKNKITAHHLQKGPDASINMPLRTGPFYTGIKYYIQNLCEIQCKNHLLPAGI
ncbi:MAG: hypothetical protein DBY17_03910 [Oscillospiraceae bacterium]|nr:MAG: hypothetical protein DBY17_03910 [Oscillospiraceae bacterium]